MPQLIVSPETFSISYHIMKETSTTDHQQCCSHTHTVIIHMPLSTANYNISKRCRETGRNNIMHLHNMEQAREGEKGRKRGEGREGGREGGRVEKGRERKGEAL